mmetsp:Transcript_90137/g.156204  ORF Transcript_90137/g.156204 Transcript_90137/m.156204 type:complete len:268 (-) Transcript_90137:131-934(-)
MIVVVSRREVDQTNWLSKLGDIPYALMTEFKDSEQKRGKRPHEFVKPRTYAGATTRECGGFAAWIVDNYDNLPTTTVFMHAAPDEWHADPHFLSLVHDISIEPSLVDYCSLNKYYTDFSTSSQRQHADIAFNRLDPQRYREFLKVVRNLWKGKHGIGTCYGAAQFAVSRERIRRRSKKFWEQFLEFLKEAPKEQEVFPITPNHRSSFPRGNERCLLIENMWHGVFDLALQCPVNTSSCRVLYEGESAYAHLEGGGLRHVGLKWKGKS